MAAELARETSAAIRESVVGSVRTTTAYEPTVDMTVPEWLRSEDA
jgi:hypothetical protein